MKIAQVSEFFAPWAGGVSEHVLHLTRELRALGHEVHVLTSRHRRGGAPVDAQIEPATHRFGWSVRFPYNGGLANVTYSPGLPRRLDAVLAREGYDIVHIHNPVTPTLPLLALDRSPALNVGTFHSYHPRERMLEMWGGMLRPAMRAATIGLCAAIASRRVIPKLSCPTDGAQNTSHVRYSSTSDWPCCCPRNSTRPRARCPSRRRQLRSKGPSPTTRRRSRGNSSSKSSKADSSVGSPFFGTSCPTKSSDCSPSGASGCPFGPKRHRSMPFGMMSNGVVK